MRTTIVAISLLVGALPVSSNPLPLPQASNAAVSYGAGAGSSTTSKGGCQFAGVNIAGFDFGADNSGSPNGAAQMQHFVNDDKQNLFRLPVEWDYLMSSPSGPMNQDKFNKYDQLMQSCLKTGAHCILDIHSYARFTGTSDGPTVGQGGPSIDDLANLWTTLAKFYAQDANVIMGIMNEPNGVDISIWSQAVQAAVNAIRGAGATKQMILLPGTDWDSAEAWSTDGSADALLKITNPGCTTSDTACSTAGLVFDFHYYFAPGGSSSECDNDGSQAFLPPLQKLRQDPNNIRHAMVTELGGGGNAQSCLQKVCTALDTLNANSDVYLGWTVWSAGAFESSYILSVLDAQGNDVPLMKQCFVAKSFGGNGPPAASGGVAGPGVGAGDGGNSTVAGGNGASPSATGGSLADGTGTPALGGGSAAATNTGSPAAGSPTANTGSQGGGDDDEEDCPEL